MTTSTVRRALVASHHLASYSGSEVLTLELATELRQMGWEVVVAAVLSDEPMASEFRKQGFPIVDLLGANPAIDNVQFDLAWVHHTPVFNELFIARQTKATKVVFCSLSHFEPLEQVPACPDRIDILLAHSAENKDFIVDERGWRDDQVAVFPNAAPGIYWNQQKEKHGQALRQLAIISNHAPVEVLEAAQLLGKKGVAVRHIGVGGTPTLMQPDLLLGCDAVVTIGKTVPYCFALKVPVYCYDHFGGPGWLTDGNFDLAGRNNFSGRGFQKKTPEVIAQELAEGYQESLQRLDVLREHAACHRDLRKNLALLIEQPVAPLPDRAASGTHTQTLGQHKQYMQLARALSAMRSAMRSIHEVELDARDKEILRVKSTLSWRCTAPFRVAYNLVVRRWKQRE